MGVRTLSDKDLDTYIVGTILDDRTNLGKFLRGFAEKERRKNNCSKSTLSLWDTLTITHKVSRPVAARRSPIIKMLKRLPEYWEEKILEQFELGNLHAESMAMFAPFITLQNIAKLLDILPGKTYREMEHLAIVMFPSKKNRGNKGRERKVAVPVEPLNVGTSDGENAGTKDNVTAEPLWDSTLEIANTSTVGLEIRTTFTGDEYQDIERLKELYPGKTTHEILVLALRKLRKSKDPAFRVKTVIAKVKVTPPPLAKARRHIPNA
jgi:hypothetical protein